VQRFRPISFGDKSAAILSTTTQSELRHAYISSFRQGCRSLYSYGRTPDSKIA